MITFNGERVTLATGVPTIATIGVSLGRIVRFAGHTEHFYTVLAHSLTVAEIMPPKFGIYGLMHDSQECLVSDVPTPMKSQVARNREHVLQQRIYSAHGIPWPMSEKITELVEWADHAALIAEAHILKHPGAEAQWGPEFDDEAARATKKNLKKVERWLDPTISGPMFVKEFKRYATLAGLTDPGEWN
jgi:hypothetical protein